MTSSLQTLAERSGFRETGRTDEVEALAAAMARAWPDAVRSFEYGRTAEGRVMRALIVSRTGALTAAELKGRNIPLLMIQAGIHPGESDGKDAGFIALRELLEAGAGTVLDRIALLFIPAFNTDGHERVGRWNRPNQNGPAETGWRTTAQNLNLNRDYMKAEAPEMHAMLRLIDEWDPLVCADLHVTDGADFEPDVSLQVEPINQGAPSLRASGVQLREQLIARVAADGSLPLPFYPDLVEPDNPESGFVLTVYSPRFSTGYFPQRNRFTVLVETHSWKPYEQRVRVTRNTILGLADLMVEHGSRWLSEAQRADAEATALPGSEVELEFASAWREPLATQFGAPALDDASNAEMIEFRGYAYTRTHSEISGGLVTRYDSSKPQIWRVPYRNKVRPSVTARVPRGGYIVVAGHADLVAAKLDLHGVQYQRLDAAQAAREVEVFRAESAAFSPAPFEGRMRLTVTGEWRKEQVAIPAGSLFVPTAQRLVRLVTALLEPRAPDSLAAWGFFNAWFEQKEHLEAYIAEPIAREMLRNDAQLAAEFQRRLATDAAFAASPAARLEFFHRRHASWDARFNLYPVYRTDG
ncbi:MAG TPA: M14 family metallopeptidase [Steroidobacteraceae bacterium]|jgi:hypothetical protein|nr:M14 family metallopeptidase [Steroidobacteraceae bacterium]